MLPTQICLIIPDSRYPNLKNIERPGFKNYSQKQHRARWMRDNGDCQRPTMNFVNVKNVDVQAAQVCRIRKVWESDNVTM